MSCSEARQEGGFDFPGMVRLERLPVENESKTHEMTAYECLLLFNLWNVVKFF